MNLSTTLHTDQHDHQGFDRERDRGQRLSADEDQSVDFERGGALSQPLDQAQQALQVHRHMQHHAEKRRGSAHGLFLLLG